MIELCNKNKCIEREQYYFDTLNPEFNILRIAGSGLGHVVSQETKDRISKTTTGRKFTEEHKQKMRIAMKGNKNGRFTKGLKKPPVKDSTRLKLSIAAIKQWERIKQNEH